MRRRPDYGVDAPSLVIGFGSSGLIAAIAAGLIGVAGFSWSTAATTILGLVAVYLLGMCSLMLVWSKLIKIRGREALLDQVHWTGTEKVLDVGCGRGLLMIGAARRLTTGTATGIDIWQARDQSANTPAGTLENALIEEVADRIVIETGDMRTLPFADAQFDIVMSHWVVHNLDAEADRNQTLREMVRVLKPGGAMILADIANRDAYRRTLQSFNMSGVRCNVSPISDAILGLVSGGSFRPATIHARKIG
jgi:arsenite methyltransferase